MQISLVLSVECPSISNTSLDNFFNFGIKFGIGISSDETRYVIKNSWNCKNDEERELIVKEHDIAEVVAERIEILKAGL